MDSLDYLQDDFDAKKITISQICSILSKHNVDLPVAKQRKDFYVDLFNANIYENRKEIRSKLESVKPSSHGIEIVGGPSAVTSLGSKIPVLSVKASSVIDITDENDDENADTGVLIEEEVEERKPSLLTAMKAPVIGKRKSLDGKTVVEILSESEAGKRFKMTKMPIEDEVVVAEPSVPSWTPRLAWKLGKPPTPMLLKTKISRSVQDDAPEAEEMTIEAPKQKRFNIQPLLPGVRQNLPPFSPQKVEHLKPVKELVAKFDDGVPVMPVVQGIPFPATQDDERDSDSTLSIAPDEYDDSFLIEKDDLKGLKHSIMDEAIESLFEKEANEQILEEDDEFALKEPRSTLSFSSLLRSIVSVMILFVVAALLAWCINEAANSSSSSFSGLSSIRTKLEAGLSFAYQHPSVAFDLATGWIKEGFSDFGTKFMKIDWKELPTLLAASFKHIAAETALFYNRNFTPFAQKTMESIKSIDFENVKTQAVHHMKLADMHLQDVREHLLEYTLPLAEKASAALTQYSLIVKYEVSKIIQSVHNSSILQTLDHAGQQVVTIAKSFEGFAVEQLKKLTTHENWKLVTDLALEYPTPFGLDSQSFVGLLFGTGLTFGVIGAFLILI